MNRKIPWVTFSTVMVSVKFLQVLETQDKNAKALFRRGQAHFHTKNFEKAEEDFRAFKLIEPGGQYMILENQSKILK